MSRTIPYLTSDKSSLSSFFNSVHMTTYGLLFSFPGKLKTEVWRGKKVFCTVCPRSFRVTEILFTVGDYESLFRGMFVLPFQKKKKEDL